MPHPLRRVVVALAIAATGGALGGAVVATVAPRALDAAAQFPQSEKVRFRLAGDEPIATPDGKGFINNWKVVILRDTKSDQCFTLFLLGSSMSATGPATCPN